MKLPNKTILPIIMLTAGFFAGLSVQETADALGKSSRTVNRAWTAARAWLKDAIGDAGEDSG